MPTLLLSKLDDVLLKHEKTERCLNLTSEVGLWNNLVNGTLHFFIILVWILQVNCTCNLTFFSL